MSLEMMVSVDDDPRIADPEAFLVALLVSDSIGYGDYHKPLVPSTVRYYAKRARMTAEQFGEVFRRLVDAGIFDVSVDGRIRYQRPYDKEVAVEAVYQSYRDKGGPK